jgi:small conductance mechanosensitive channel
LALDIPTDPTLPPFVDQARRLLFGDSELMRHMADAAGGLAVNLALAGLILAGTLWAASWLSRLAGRAIQRAHRRSPPDATLQSFVTSLVRYVVVIIGLIAVLQQLGVKATSVIAVLGAASLAIGLALQGALSNVAAGVMLLVLRPYRVGDAVEIDGKTGTVRGLDLFATRLSDGENLMVFVPNAKAFGAVIVNLSAPVVRRAQLDFVIDYGDDVDRALALLLACASAEKRVSEKPAPWARLTAMGDKGLTVSVRAWIAPKDYDDTRFDLLKAAKERLEAAGFSFPYPHQVAVAQRSFEPPQSKTAGASAGDGAAPSPRSFSPPPTTAGSSPDR